MRKLIQNIALFSLPIWILLGILYLQNPPKSYSYTMIQKDCRTGTWIYKRLFESQVPIDIAFIGTSKTMCDVNDALLEEQLSKTFNLKRKIANLGVCRTGENLHYLIARDLFAQKKPKAIVLELSTKMVSNSHFHFPYLAAFEDVLAAPKIINNDYLGDFVTLGWNRLIYQREKLFGIERKFEEILDDSLHSYMLVEKDMVADSADMERVKAKRTISLSSAAPKGIGAWIYGLESRIPKYYFEEIAHLAQVNGTQLIFLYLPVYGAASDAPQELNYYQQFGTVWIPPDSVFGDSKLHMDNSHLNNAGATKLNDWLVSQVARLAIAE